MSAISRPLSINVDRPVDPATLHILQLIDGLLRNAGIEYMLVGATARDLLLHHVHGHRVTRATYDIDFAILVDSWDRFTETKAQFLEVAGFSYDAKNVQRVFFRETLDSHETVIDIIPFGGVEAKDRTIAWPPDADIVMNVAAFSEVFESSLTLSIAPDLTINVPSLAGLMLLKLFAWLDRRDDRDVQDIRRLLETYADAGNEERLYDEIADELERFNFDVVLAGGYLLGRDAAAIVQSDTRRQLTTAFNEHNTAMLVTKLARSISVHEDWTEFAQNLFSAFCHGLDSDVR
jgi:predicted nucleotidyltransferase